MEYILIKHSHLSNYSIRKIIGCFYSDLSATQTAEITGFNRNTINRFFNIFREFILFDNIKTIKTTKYKVKWS
jgi:hypothetical protein